MSRMMKKGLMMRYYYASSTSSSSLRVRRSICSEAAGYRGGLEEFVVKVRSESMVKPSSSTPLSRRHFKLSLIDAQFSPAMYSSFVLFYPPDDTMMKRKISLRDSLSKALSHLYPLAGRIHLQEQAPLPSSVDCSDQGVLYLEAEVNQEMLHFLTTSTSTSTSITTSSSSNSSSSSAPPDAQLLGRLAPARPRNASAFFSDAPPPLASVQATAFRCGGMAVGICVSHLIGDAQTIAELLNKWASISKGTADGDGDDDDDDNKINRNYSSSVSDMGGRSLFPLENFDFTNIAPYEWGTSTGTSTTSSRTSVVMERLVFKREAISRLKAQVVRSSGTGQSQTSSNPPSRSLVIFGLIWKAAMHAHVINTNNNDNVKVKVKQPSNALVTVNLRPRFNTPLPDNVMGNILWSSAAHYEHEYDHDDDGDEEEEEEEEVELERLVGLLRKSVDQVDGEFAEKLTGEKGHVQIRKWMEERASSGSGGGGVPVKEYHFSSVLNFKVGFNAVDFGWGKPLWVTYLGISDMLFPNFVAMLEASGPHADADGGGDVEAWVTLDEKEMALFRKDPQLLRYALLNPTLHL